MKLITEDLLNHVSSQAEQSPRLRMNYNFHESLNAPIQRMLNALEIGTALPIHRHRHTAETYLLIRGRIRVIFYCEDGTETESFVLDPSTGNYGIHIPMTQWHSLDVLESNSVIFEVKDGPYAPLEPEDMLP